MDCPTGTAYAFRPPPHWLAFELRREVALRDYASAVSVETTIVALLAELAEVPSVEVRNTPLPWLERVREQLHDEFRQRHTLAGLARTAGVHHVHLAREFRRSFGCTVGQYIRQRRVVVACHRLATASDSLSRIAFDAGFADQSHFTNTSGGWLAGPRASSEAGSLPAAAAAKRSGLISALIVFKTTSTPELRCSR